ncbi:SycD/LcrH family type III secretion system chaperone [Parachitinimonas caeni]|uniref:SycD/LcrH family type III secretion system chaperone n=1 Tax=Parachitinimonas caeni TaxID=3031301 RepID=A0ABT7DWL3_9NEIS|nr:SycD/LcrH family type III secretion system chaperone [Parachitinimonas caeni]MDK2123488.1 SycD/LcrH family type III secretion system chaperone [Parachitinimonas caeni]
MNTEPITDEQIERLASDLTELWSIGGTLKDVYGFTPEECEAVYTLGYNLYNQGKFLDALKAFGFLLMHDHLERRYYKSFASALQMLKRYEEAIKHYSIASMLDLSDPEPTFHTGECMVGIGMIEEAKEAFDLVVRQTEKKEAYAVMHEQAKALLALLEKREEATS